jgi:hypothetical protein
MWGAVGMRAKRARATLPQDWQKAPDIRRIVGEGPSAVMKSAWRDPDDLRVNARAAREITGHRAYCPLRWTLKRFGSESRITERHIAAADRLRQAVDLVVTGRGGVSWPTGILAGMLQGIRDLPSATARANIRAVGEVRRAMRLYSQGERELVTHVVLLNHAVSNWVEFCRRDRGIVVTAQTEMSRLVGCLDRLEEHYASEIDRLVRKGWMP